MDMILADINQQQHKRHLTSNSMYLWQNIAQGLLASDPEMSGDAVVKVADTVVDGYLNYFKEKINV